MVDTYLQALGLLAATPDSLQAVIAANPPEALDRSPAPDAWSIRQILAHLLHIETAVLPVRVRQMLAEPGAAFPDAPPAPPPADVETMLARWTQARTGHLVWLRGLKDEDLARTGRHPRYGTISVREQVVEWAYHDLDHLRQILATIQGVLYADIGGYRALYPLPV